MLLFCIECNKKLLPYLNASIKEPQREILLIIKGQYMKESNTHAGNATFKHLQSPILLGTKRQYMEESSVAQRSFESKTERHELLP